MAYSFNKKKRIRKDFGKKVRQVAESKLDLKICADLHEQAYQVLTNND